MTKILLAISFFSAGLVTTSGPLFGKGAAAHELLTCWYNESGELTGSEPAAPGDSAGTKEQADASGDHSWSYKVLGHDQSACPARLPVSSNTSR